MKILLPVLFCIGLFPTPPCYGDETSTVDLRGKQGIPKDLKKSDPKPKKLETKEPPPPEVEAPKRQNVRRVPKGVSAVRD